MFQSNDKFSPNSDSVTIHSFLLADFGFDCNNGTRLGDRCIEVVGKRKFSRF